MIYYVLTKNEAFLGVLVSNPYVLGLPSDITISEMDEELPDLNTHTWDYVNQEFVYNSRTMNKYPFICRFTNEERALMLSSTDVNIKNFMEMLNLAQIVDLDDPNLYNAIQYLKYVGILSEARAQEIMG